MDTVAPPRTPPGHRGRVLAALLALLLGATVVVATPPTAAAADHGEVLADFEDGVPTGWFVYSGPDSTVDTPVEVVADTDPDARPGQVGVNQVLAVDHAVTDFGGFGQDLAADGAPMDLSGTDGMRLWLNGTGSGLVYQLEIADNRSDPADDTAERFDVEIVDDTAGWREIVVPWSDFTRATDFQPVGAPDDGLTLTEVWSWAIVLPQGSDAVLVDDVTVDGAVGQPQPSRSIIDFEDGLPPASTIDGTDVTLGFSTFSDGGSPVGIAVEGTPPAPARDDAPDDNQALGLTADIGSFAGFAQLFGSDGAWEPQDWSAYEGISFWLYGRGSDTTLFLDLVDDRAEGTDGDTGERFSVTIPDDFTGWRLFELPFEDFARKDVGNGAPNNGFGRTQIHGWAFGGTTSPGEQTWWIDDVALYGDAAAIPLSVSFGEGITRITEGETGDVTVTLNRALTADDGPVTVDYTTEPAAALPDREYTPVSGTLTFEPGGPRELSFPVETFDDDEFEGDERIVLRLSDPTNATPGAITQASVLITDDEQFDPLLLDDFDREPYEWDATDDVALSTPELAAEDPMAVPGQDDFEGVLQIDAPEDVAVQVRIEAVSNRICTPGNGVTPVVLYGSEALAVTDIDITTLTVSGARDVGGGSGSGVGSGAPHRRIADVDGDGIDDLLLRLRFDRDAEVCDTGELTVDGTTLDGRPLTTDEVGVPSFGRDLPGSQDWSESQSVSFWWYGDGTGDEVVLEVLDNEAPDPGPDGWELAWSDEFDDDAGTPPDPANWGYEIGDVTPDGKLGWGNEERQYYTDSTDNVRHDGEGNLEIVLRAEDGDRQCYYGPCEYSSGRLLSHHRQEFQYGRIESRIKVPQGAGLWPAFWSLGTDIEYNPWPGAGEIDIMEYVGRIPDEIFGTIHGPGYSGGQSFSGTVSDQAVPVHEDFHTYAIEWEPGLIRWYYDGELYHTATPQDVAPNPWVFDKPYFLLLNQAIGGNFGGRIDPDIEQLLPAVTEFDYVRVYQAPDTAERFEASFVDDTRGWRRVTIPFDDLQRSAVQPDGAPDDGLTLTAVNGYGVRLPTGIDGGTAWIDEVRLDPIPPPTEVTVTAATDAGPGSLRAAIADVAEGGTIALDPALADATLALDAPLTLTRDVTIDASAAPGFTIDGQGAHRGLVVEEGVTATVTDLTITNGYGFQLGGGIRNDGDLTLRRVSVVGNTMTTDAGDFWQGGGGIHTGEDGALTLIDSVVADNDSGWAGGGLYGSFGSSLTVTRSTISGNVAQDVGGGIRSLGDTQVTDSTLSGNTSSAWHGGGVFATDGTVEVTRSAVVDNLAPDGLASELMVATFGAPVTVTVRESTIRAGGTYACQVEGDPALAVLDVDASTVASDDSCGGATVGDP